MAKPKGATLTKLFAVSDEERKQFWAKIEAQKTGRSGDTIGTPIIAIPEMGIPDSDRQQCSTLAPSFHLPTSSLPVLGTAISGVPEIGIPKQEEHQPSAAPLPLPQLPKRRIREAVRVQDGHSLGEQAVYTALWNSGQPHTDDCRRITIGYRTLSDLCGLSVNNCKANLQTLRRKLAIEEIAAATRSRATTYLVYSYQAILRRRRQAGMTHVIKTKGVIFVHLETGAPISGVPYLNDSVPETCVPEIQSCIPVSTISGVPDSGTSIGNKKFIEESADKKPSSSAFPLVSAAAAKYGLALDDAAARRIVLRCQTFNENATEEEVAHFLEVKVTQLRNSRNVSNPVGLLIRAVPEYFSPPGTELQRFREYKAREAEQSREFARQILQDPESPEESREWAHSVLREVSDEEKEHRL